MRTDLAAMRLGIFAPPMVEPFQPSLTLPYMGARLRELGLSPVCHNLSSVFFVWLFRRVRLESMARYEELASAVATLRDPRRFFNWSRYSSALGLLEEYVSSLAERDGLPYSLFPGSRASAISSSEDLKHLVDEMSGSLIERFLLDYVGFTLRLESYDVIGFSATNAFQLAAAAFIAQALKSAGIPAHLILGGHAVSLLLVEAIENSILVNCFDSIVLKGDAEVLATACVDVREGRARRIYGDADSLCRTDQGPFATDRAYELTLQHDVDDLYLSPARILTVYSAQGCRYGRCTFCSSNRALSPYVPREISVLADEMESAQARYGITHFNLCDNNFDPFRVSAFCAELERRGLQDFSWQCTSRVYRSLDVPLLRRMRANGCAIMSVGLEAASDRILRLMRKGYTVADTAALLDRMEAAGMPVHVYCICGYPGETVAESRATLTFLKRHIRQCHSVYFQDYDAQLAAKVFADEIGSVSRGLRAEGMIAALCEDPAVSAQFAWQGHLLRRRGYPFVEDHNFMYLASENEQHGRGRST